MASRDTHAPLHRFASRVHSDLSTPGAFWLNPSLPRDAEGYSVNPETGLRWVREGQGDEGGDATVTQLLEDVDPR